MQAVHEFGHVIHAAISGGQVARVVLHPAEISRTDVAPNPYPLFVAWGGPIWGCIIPVAVAFLCRKLASPVSEIARFFAGFCLIANGAYIGTGIVYPVGDAEQLLRHGAPAWTLAAFGLIAILAGLWFWHRLGENNDHNGIRFQARPASALTMAAVVVIVVMLELALD
jgi:hypothetical protein